MITSASRPVPFTRQGQTFDGPVTVGDDVPGAGPPRVAPAARVVDPSRPLAARGWVVVQVEQDRTAPAREQIGSIELDRGGHEVSRDGEAVGLTPTEYKLFVELADHAGMVLSRQVLLERVWGYGWAGDTRLVDVHIQRLRAKVEDDPANPRIILTVRGVGYKLQR